MEPKAEDPQPPVRRVRMGVNARFDGLWTGPGDDPRQTGV